MEETSITTNHESSGTIARIVPIVTLFVSLATLILLIKYMSPSASFSESDAWVGSVVDGGGIVAPANVVMSVQAVISNPAIKTRPYALVNLGTTGETRHIAFTNRSQEVVIVSGSSIVAKDGTSSANRRGDYDVCCRGSEAGACGWRSAGICHEVCGASACGGASIVFDEGNDTSGPYEVYVLDSENPGLVYTAFVNGTDVKITKSSSIVSTDIEWSLHSQLIEKSLSEYMSLNSDDEALSDIESLKTDIATYLDKIAN